MKVPPLPPRGARGEEYRRPGRMVAVRTERPPEPSSTGAGTDGGRPSHPEDARPKTIEAGRPRSGHWERLGASEEPGVESGRRRRSRRCVLKYDAKPERSSGCARRACRAGAALIFERLRLDASLRLDAFEALHRPRPPTIPRRCPPPAPPVIFFIVSASTVFLSRVGVGCVSCVYVS